MSSGLFVILGAIIGCFTTIYFHRKIHRIKTVRSINNIIQQIRS